MGGGGESSGRAVEGGGLTCCVNTSLETGKARRKLHGRAERGRLDHNGGRGRKRHENTQADRLVNMRTVSREVHTMGYERRCCGYVMGITPHDGRC